VRFAKALNGPRSTGANARFLLAMEQDAHRDAEHAGERRERHPAHRPEPSNTFKEVRNAMPRMTRSLSRPLFVVCLVLSVALVPGNNAPAQAQTTDPGSGQGGGARNVVVIENRVDGRLTTRGQVQLNRTPGPTAGPVNLASANTSCIDCQSLAVAFQINLISRTASSITPENVATATNAGCTRCYTVARALQYVIQVDDPTQVPPEASRLSQTMNRELTAIQADPTISLDEAEARINAVLAQFVDLAEDLSDQRDVQVDPTSPTPTATPVPGTTPEPPMTPTPSPTASAGLTIRVDASATPTTVSV
jgi:putative peptide zinc metalloprotease protein